MYQTKDYMKIIQKACKWKSKVIKSIDTQSNTQTKELFWKLPQKREYLNDQYVN